MDFELSPQQMETALRLCDILSLEDLTVAAAILDQSQWNLEKAISMVQQPQKLQQPQQPQQQQVDPYAYDDIEPEEYDYQEYEYEFNKEVDLEQKKKMFQNEYVSFPLHKTTSEGANRMQKRLLFDRLLKQDFSQHRHAYQVNLLHHSEKLCEKILSSKSKEVQLFYKNKKKNQNNQQFLLYLHQKYKTYINFTFGTFLLNLTRSYLDKKFLLVYVHKSQFQDNQSIKMILHQRQIANFINKNCISYGMFDSSDDYQIIQRYVPMKNLPAFVLFKFNKKQQRQEYISQYSILKNDQVDLIQWLAPQLGITVKKKQQQQKQQMKEQAFDEFAYTITDIVNSQNKEYEEMAKLYQLRRDKSKVRKEEIAKFEEELQKLKEKYQTRAQPSQNRIQIKFRLPLSGKSLIYAFSRDEKVGVMFEYVNCFGRDQFEDRYAEFDLTQTFPRLSLIDKQDQQIEEIFSGSEGQNIIVKEV